ncbi:MAG: type II toxin-antitoxin system mRNA interferase toxin, RelE/StbE family [Deltaproteobacteria bacterium]|nr:type II toxin-antitoxin system mRNA interferase toxin, RelE/StbE family [Deltaproteobacteria bacterium]
MNKYRIFETERFQKDLQHIVMSGRTRIARKLQEFVYPQLRNHPHFGSNIKKHKGFKPDTWRYRVGSWRFFYEINEQEQIVFMIAASHRSSAY